MAFSDARNERDRADTGRNSGNHGGRDNQGAERRNREAMNRNARTGDAKSAQMRSLENAIAGRTPGLTPSGQRAAQVDATMQGARGWGSTDFAKAVRDFQDQGGWNRALDFFTGVHEVNPVNSWNGTPNASWGFDPLGAALGAAGLASGFPVGGIYSGMKALTGWQGPEVAFSGSPIGYGRAPAGMPGGQPGQMAGQNRFGGNSDRWGQQMAQRPKAQPSIPGSSSQPDQWGPAPTPRMPNLLAPQMPGLNQQPSGGLLGMSSWR